MVNKTMSFFTTPILSLHASPKNQSNSQDRVRLRWVPNFLFLHHILSHLLSHIHIPSFAYPDVTYRGVWNKIVGGIFPPNLLLLESVLSRLPSSSKGER